VQIVETAIFVNLSKFTAHAGITGVALPAVACTLLTEWQVSFSFFQPGSPPAALPGATFRFALKETPTGDPLIFNSSLTASGAVYTADFSSVDSDALRTLIGDQPTIEVVGEIEWTISSRRERVHFPVTVTNAWARPDDAAPDPVAEASIVWFNEQLATRAVRFDVAQTLTTEQQEQGRTNLGITGTGGGGGGIPIDFDNGSFIDAGDPAYGSNSGGGIEQICAADYRQRWEGGRLWFYDQNGTGVREVRLNFSDPSINDDAKDSLRFRVGSRWVHEDGREWVCSDATEGAAVWDYVASGTQGPPGTNATPITSISDDGSGNLTINTAEASYGPFALKGPPGNNGADGGSGPQGDPGPQGDQGPEATPITSISDDGNGNLTINTASASYGPFALKGPQGNQGTAGSNGNDATPITSISDDGYGNLTINTASASYGPFALKGPQGDPGSTGDQGPEATPITSVTDDGSGNLTIHTASASYGPFALKGPQGDPGSQGDQGPAGPEATPITSIYDDGNGNLTITAGGNSYGPFALKGPAGNDGPQGAQGDPGTTSWLGITDKPTTFTPSSHTHSGADITSGTVDGDRLPSLSTTKRGGVPATGTPSGKFLRDGGTWANPIDQIQLACSDETTALTAGTNKVTFRMPYAMTLTAVRASVTTAPTGSLLIVDINEGGTSVLSTKLSINATEKTSTTAATLPVISDSALADDAEITIDIDQIGSTIAGAGLKVTLIGTRA